MWRWPRRSPRSSVPPPAFPGHQSPGLLLCPAGAAQVVPVVVDYEAAPLYRAVEVIRMEAARWGARVMGTGSGADPGQSPDRFGGLLLAAGEGFDPGRRQVLEYHLIGSGGGKHE